MKSDILNGGGVLNNLGEFFGREMCGPECRCDAPPAPLYSHIGKFERSWYRVLSSSVTTIEAFVDPRLSVSILQP
jgi:hypothetical protein